MTQGITSYNIGDTFEGFLLIKNTIKGTTQNGKPFLTLELSDTTGSMDAKFWDVTETDIATYTTGKVVEIKANIIEFRGRPQLQLQRIEISAAAQQIDPSFFMETSPIDKQALIQEITETAQHIENDTVRQLVQGFIDRYIHELFIYPAAKTIHHAFLSGIAHHVCMMLQIAKSVTSLYPELNKDLLFAGVILHDVGKIHEFTSETDTTTTREGHLLGHIPIMVAEIREMAIRLGMEKSREEVVLLQHMILSHHGKPEWGSSRTPLLLEAEMLHLIDRMDASMNTIGKALSTTKPGDFTDKIFGFDNRRFYQPQI